MVFCVSVYEIVFGFFLVERRFIKYDNFFLIDIIENL